jgi:hypothetical protein
MRVLAGLALSFAVLAPAHVGWASQETRVVTTGSFRQAGASSSGSLSRELIERMGDRLGLDEVQREIAMDLYRALSDTRQQLADGLREAIEAERVAVEGGITLDFGKIKALTGEYQRATKALEATYLTDLRSMLSEEQAESWPAAERVYRRGTSLGSLMRSEARVDLEELVREQRPEALARAEVSNVLERWAVQVDGLLQERERRSEALKGDAEMDLKVVLMGGDDDPFEELREIDARIASAGDQTLRTLAAVLEDDGLREAWLRKAYTRVFRQTQAEARLEAAMALENLTDDQRSQLEAAGSQHERDASAARSRWVQAEREREEEDRLVPGVMIKIQGAEPSASDLARRAIDELDERLESKLAAILTEAQIGALPARPERKGGDRIELRGSTIRIGG